MSSNDERSPSTKTNEKKLAQVPLTVNALRERLFKLEKEGKGHLLVTHSNNCIYNAELTTLDNITVVTLVGLIQK